MTEFTQEELSWIKRRGVIEYQLNELNKNIKSIDEKLEFLMIECSSIKKNVEYQEKKVDQIDEIKKEVGIIKTDVAVQQTKVLFIGTIASIVTTGIILLIIKYI